MKFTEAMQYLRNDVPVQRRVPDWDNRYLSLDDEGQIVMVNVNHPNYDYPHLDIIDVLAEDWDVRSEAIGLLMPGDIVLYKRRGNDEHYEIGEISSVCTDGSNDCFVWYHQGDTAARTPYSCLRRISNLYAFDVKRIRASDVERGEIDEDD